MFQTTDTIQKAFKDAGIQCATAEGTAQGKPVSEVRVMVSGKQMPKATIQFVSNSDNPDFTACVLGYVKVPEGKRVQALEMANDCNLKYRYCKFAVDPNDNVNVTYDAPFRAVNPGDIAVETLGRFMRILDTVYPDFMEAMWS